MCRPFIFVRSGQVPTEQHIAVLYPLLETDLRLHVDAMLATEFPTIEATFEAIRMAFEAVQPIQDPRGDFFSRRQQLGESLHSFYLGLVRLAAKAFPTGKR